MATQKTKFAVGLFVTSGVGIALMAFIWLGMSRYFEKGQYYAAYFNESVQGLDIDSPVKYRGVSIGRVESIDVAPDSKLIQVVLRIESVQTLDRGIVAQLKSVGITGSMFVELDRKKEGEADLTPKLTFPSDYPIVASKPSDISQLLKGLDDVLSHIQSLDLKGISDKIKLTLDNISDIVVQADMKEVSDKVNLTLDNINLMIADANVKGISRNIHASLERVGRILDNPRWDNITASVEEASRSLNTLLTEANRSLSQVERTLERVDGIVVDKEDAIKAAIEDFRLAVANANVFLEKGSSLVSGTDDSFAYLKRHLMVIAQNLEKASENLNRAIDLLADHPPQLLFGQPPAPRPVEPEESEK